MSALSNHNPKNNQHVSVPPKAATWLLATLLGLAPLAAMAVEPAAATGAASPIPATTDTVPGATAAASTPGAAPASAPDSTSNSQAAAAQLKKLVILDFELDDNSGVITGQKEQTARLAIASQLLRQEFAKNHLYTVVDNAPAAQLISDTKNRLVLHDCNGCDVDIAKALDADRVLTAWVQKVSNLILQINIRIRDVKTDNVMLRKQITIRGNTDKSWSRGIDFMVRDIVDKKEGNR